MKIASKIMAALTSAICLISPAIAAPSPTPVPEIDGSMAVIALGLTAAIVAIIKESRRK